MRVKMTVIGSGSSGNCYLLDDGKNILVIEAGCPFYEVKEAIDYQTSKIVGVLCTHSHQDHCKYLQEYRDSGVPVMEGDYIDATCLINGSVTADGKGKICFGPYSVHAFPCVHDVPCYGFIIDHNDMGRLIFVTDTEYIKYRFLGVNHIMVEANYAQDIIDENVSNGIIPESLRNRIMKSHTSLETAKGIVKANNNPLLRNVVLLHLSGHNSDRQRFVTEVNGIVRDWTNVTAAEKGMVVDFGYYPF